MTIDICKILHNPGVRVRSNKESISNALRIAVDENPKKLLEDTYEAVTRDVGLDVSNRPGLCIVFKPNNEKGVRSCGGFNTQTLITDINNHHLLKAKRNETLFHEYSKIIYTMNHETRHFIQSLWVVKDRGFDAFLQKFKPDVLDGNYNRKFYERNATSLEPLSEQERKLVFDILEYKDFSTKDKSGNLTLEYEEAPEEIDANHFAEKKTNEIFSAIKPKSTLIDSVMDFWCSAFGKKVA